MICQEDRSKTVGDILLQVSTVPTLKLTLRYLWLKLIRLKAKLVDTKNFIDIH